MPEDLEFTMPGNTSNLYVLLKPDYSVEVLNGPRGEPTGEVGNWTVVYDQAVVVELLSQHKAKYTANFRYSLKPEIEERQFDDLKAGSYEAFNSRCSETMVGVKLNVDKTV